MPELWAGPMVRISSLPFRQLCLEYGASRVFSPELVDKLLLECERFQKGEVIEYITKKGAIVFQTTIHEKPFLTLQIGSSNAVLALKAALTVQQDISEINLNCGCPKKFSIHAGMGAALLNDVDRLCDILTTLVKGLKVPVSAKIRLCPDFDINPGTTINLLNRIQATGIKHLIIHARKPSDRPDKAALWEAFEILRPYQSVPWIANGDLFTYNNCVDFENRFPFMKTLMISRAAMSNPSIFSKSPESLRTIGIKLVKYALMYNSNFTYTKYSLMQMWPDVHNYPLLLHSRDFNDLMTFVIELR